MDQTTPTEKCLSFLERIFSDRKTKLEERSYHNKRDTQLDDLEEAFDKYRETFFETHPTLTRLLRGEYLKDEKAFMKKYAPLIVIKDVKNYPDWSLSLNIDSLSFGPLIVRNNAWKENVTIGVDTDWSIEGSEYLPDEILDETKNFLKAAIEDDALLMMTQEINDLYKRAQNDTWQLRFNK